MDLSSSAFQSSAPFPSSTSAPRGNSGVARPPGPMAPAPAKKKQRKFVTPHPRPTAPPPSDVVPRRHDLPRQQAPTPSAGMPPRQQASTPGTDLPPHATSFTEPPPYNLSSSRPSTTAWDICSSASLSTLGYEDDYFSSIPTPVFDWTPDYSANDPLPSSSQPLLNLLGQDADADLQLLMPSDATPSSGGKGASKRGGNYTHDKDIQLCNSWINISNDPVVGTDQSGKTYWERIAANFHKNKTFEFDRTSNSLEHRFQSTILKECMKFHGYFEEVERRHPSGVPHEEYVMQAQARYARVSSGKTCQFIHCWRRLRHTEKFATTRKKMMMGKSKDINLNLSAESQQAGEGGQDGVQGQEKAVRPPGRKKSKEKLKRSDDGDDEYRNMMQNLMAMKAEEHALRQERWKKDTRIEERRLEIEHQRLLWEQEKEIMFCDVSKLDEQQRSYVLMKRGEIVKATLLSAGGGGSSVDESACVAD